MSQQNLDVVRQPIALRDRSRRRMEERLARRFPGALASLTRRVLRMPLHSRLRKVLIRRGLRMGFEAINRRDYEVGFCLYHPDVEASFAAELAALGESGTRGLEDRIRFQRDWNAEWNEFRFEPSELIDFEDDRLLVLGRIMGGGSTSGVGVDHDWAMLVTLTDGQVIREQIYSDHLVALAAAGLRS